MLGFGKYNTYLWSVTAARVAQRKPGHHPERLRFFVKNQRSQGVVPPRVFVRVVFPGHRVR